MTEYLATFSISLAIIAIIQNWPKRSIGFIFWSIVAILIPCLLAALRANTIGTDVSGYSEPMSQLALQSSSFEQYQGMTWHRVWRYSRPSDFEIGYSLMVWFVSRTFGGVIGVHFVTQLLTIVPIYIGLAQLRDKMSSCLGMLLYYFIYYNTSLNIMRQWIAIGWLLLGISFLLRGKKKPYFIMIAIAFLFHTTAILGIALYVLQRLFAGKKGKSRTKLLVIGITGIGILILIRPITMLMSRMGLSYYAAYLGSVSFLPRQFLLRLPVLLLLIWWWKRAESDKNWAAALIALFILDMLVSQFASANEQSGRIAYYFGSSLIYGVPLAIRKVRGQIPRLSASSCVTLYAILYWIYVYVITGATQTVPYLFIKGL